MEAADKGHNGPVILSVSDGHEELHLLGDKLALRRVVGNIIENAIKYGRSARVALAREAGDIVLTVDDEGPGIPVEKRLLIFEPFTRFDLSRSRKTGGAGLGLAIARMFVEAHGGAIEIRIRRRARGSWCACLPSRRPRLLLFRVKREFCSWPKFLFFAAATFPSALRAQSAHCSAGERGSAGRSFWYTSYNSGRRGGMENIFKRFEAQVRT